MCHYIHTPSPLWGTSPILGEELFSHSNPSFKVEEGDHVSGGGV